MRAASFYVFLALLLPLFMPSGSSLWIDELQTYQHVAPASLHAWTENFFGNTFSESLMPLSMFLAWHFGQDLRH